MAVLTPKSITGLGVTGTYVAASATGDSFPANSDQRVVLHVKNGGASPIMVTIPAQTVAEKVPDAGSIAVPPLGGSIAATSDAYFGPFPADYLGANGQVQFVCSAVATVTVAAYILSQAD